MDYPGYKRYSREDLIAKYDLTEDEQTYLLDELLAIEEEVYEKYIKEGGDR
ncbi:MAG: hypothetical protein J5822_00625 [Eubacteriaceae bacterium]|nr:hypothetical protein [Eubacteriaceae bacterium]